MAKASIRDQAAASALCVECGLCCSGALFDDAKLKQDEIGQAQEMGLTVLTSPIGRPSFALPCKFLSGTRCSRYREHRPDVCGSFYCKLVLHMDQGDISAVEAHQRVEEVHMLLRRIAPLLRPDETISQARTRWRNAKGQTAGSNQDAQLYVLLAGLSLLLDRHFRQAGQETLSLT